MTGGWRPPTPPEPNWLDDLPAAPGPEELVEGAFYVMRGTAVGSSSEIVNPVLVFAEGNLHVALRGQVGTSTAWHYDEQNDVLIDNGNSTSGMAANIRDQLVDYPVGGSRTVGSITKEMVVARFL